MPDRRRAAQLSTAVGLLVAVLGAVFVVRAIARESEAVSDALGDASWGWLVAAVPTSLAGMTAVGLPWRRAFGLLGHPVRVRPMLFWYFAGQLGKYVPGGVWPVVGRGELARRGGVPRPAAYSSVVLSLGATYLAAVMVVAALAPFDLADRSSGALALVVLLLPAGLVVLHPRVLGGLKALGERVLRRELGIPVPRWGESVRLVALHLPAWFLIGTATWFVAKGFDPSAGYVDVVFAAVLSWIVGFVVIPVPGGLGVREAAFVAAVAGFGSGLAATVAVAARLSFMTADLVGAALATTLFRDRPTSRGESVHQNAAKRTEARPERHET